MASSRRKRSGFGGFAGLGGILATLTIVAGVAFVTPVVEKGQVDAERRRAGDAIAELARAIEDYHQDTGFSPRGLEGRPVYGWLRGPGAEPLFRPRPQGEPGRLSWFLSKPFMAGEAAWQGPYLDGLVRDPWGRCYLVVFGSERGPDGEARRPGCLVLSAGPDGIVQSDLEALRPAGDDVAALVEF